MTQPQPACSQKIGQAVLDFSLADLHDQPRALQSLLDGKKGAVVVFWSGICSHCVRYDEYLNGFCALHPEIGLVAVASRQGESIQQIQASARERNLRFPILHDSDSAVARQWSVQQTPRVFLLDSERVLLYRGAIDNFKYSEDTEYQAYLEPAVSSYLAGQPIARPETARFGCAIQSVYYILPKPF